MLNRDVFEQQLELILEDVGVGLDVDTDETENTGIGTNTVEGAGVLNRIRGAYGELKTAYDFAKRSGMDEETIREIDEIGGRIIQLVERLTNTEEDTDYAEDDRSPV